MNHLVFVYGTLRRGHPNQVVLTDHKNGKATFVKEAKTVEKWPLVIATKFNLPFMLYKPGHGHHVIGEIYEVDDDMLQHLDWFEDSPKWYKRCRLFVTDLSADAAPVNSSATINNLFHVAADSNNEYKSSDGGSGQEIECWGYVLEDFKDDLAEQEFFADYNVAVKRFQYDKKKEEAEDERLDYSKSVTLKNKHLPGEKSYLQE